MATLKDFLEVEKGVFHLWDLSNNNVYLKLENTTRKLLFKRILKEFDPKNYHYMLKETLNIFQEKYVSIKTRECQYH